MGRYLNCCGKCVSCGAEYELVKVHLLYHLTHHGFCTMDYTTCLQKEFTNKRFYCTRTKCKSVVTNVFYSWSLEELNNDLKSGDFVTVSCNACNLKLVKLLHIAVSQCQGYGFDTPINNEISAFVEISGEAFLRLDILVVLIRLLVTYGMANTSKFFGNLETENWSKAFLYFCFMSYITCVSLITT